LRILRENKKEEKLKMSLIKNTVFMVDLADSSFYYSDENTKLPEIIEKKVWLALQSALLDSDKDQDPLFLKVNVNLDANTIAKLYSIKKILKCNNCSDNRKKSVGSDYILAFMTILDYDSEDKIYKTLNIHVSTLEQAVEKIPEITETINKITPIISSKDLKSTMLRFILGKGD